MRPKLDPFVRTIDQVPEDDKGRLKTQRQTAKRIHERLRDEHGVTGGITIVTDYVRERKLLRPRVVQALACVGTTIPRIVFRSSSPLTAA
ncbi:hypothetical protein V8324_19945, partial [Roseovarius sp. D22-M7]